MVKTKALNSLDSKIDLAAIRTNPPRNMSVCEAACYLGICVRSVRDKIATLELKHVRFGSRIILRKVDLDAYFESLLCK